MDEQLMIFYNAIKQWRERLKLNSHRPTRRDTTVGRVGSDGVNGALGRLSLFLREIDIWFNDRAYPD